MSLKKKKKKTIRQLKIMLRKDPTRAKKMQILLSIENEKKDMRNSWRRGISQKLEATRNSVSI